MDLNSKINDLTHKLTANKFSEVIEEGNELVKKFPNLFIFYNIVGLAHQGITNLEESEKYFLKAIEINPEEVGPKNNLANTYSFLGKLEDLKEEHVVPRNMSTGEFMLECMSRGLNDFRKDLVISSYSTNL